MTSYRRARFAQRVVQARSIAYRRYVRAFLTAVLFAAGCNADALPGMPSSVDGAWVPGPHALLCDGVDDMVSFDLSGLLQHATAFTVEMWMRSDGPFLSGMEYSVLQSPSTTLPQYNFEFDVYEEHGTPSVGEFLIHFDYCDNGIGQQAALNPPATWHHLAAEYRQGADATTNAQVFFDGHRISEFTEYALPDCFIPSMVYLCGEPEIQSFHGAVDGLRISSVARYASDFNPPILTADANTVALLQFESLPLVDDSPNHLAISTQGDPQLTDQVPRLGCGAACK